MGKKTYEPRLEQWCLAGHKLKGEVHNHRWHIDGTRVTTSALYAIDGDSVITASGTKYKLGEPAYDTAMAELHHHLEGGVDEQA